MNTIKRTGKKIAFLLAAVMLITMLSATMASASSENKTSVSLVPGKTTTLTHGVRSTCKSSNTAVATVSKKGVVTAKAPGKAKVTVTSGHSSYTCTVSVLKQTYAIDRNTNGMTSAEAKAYKAIRAKKASYPEGMTWTNRDSYKWKGRNYSVGYGCAAFAYEMSDAAFGDAKAKKTTDFDHLHPGDIIRMEYDTHSVVVMKVVGSTVVVAEGNINGKIHWGRKITKSQIKKTGTYVLTRY